MSHNAYLSDLLMKLYGNSDEAIFFFDRQGKVLAMNSAAEEILEKDVYQQMTAGRTGAICKACKGYTSSDEPLTCVSCYMSNPDEDISSFQVYFDTKGRGVIPYSGSIQTIDEETGTRVFMLRDLTDQFKTQEELNQKLMMKRVIKAQEDERKRISRELHDSVAQEMLSSLVDLRVLKYMNIEEDVLKKVRQTEGSLMRLLDDIRHLSVELRPATLDDLGLEAAFRTHFKWVEKNYGLVIHFHPELESKRYEGEIETVVYRICQEAVFNALKYAEVDEMIVRLYETEGSLHLLIVDEGKGFELKNTDPQGTGLGIYGMKERAELVDGRLLIRSGIGKGTVIQLDVPVAKGGNDD
ncbi:sensor histidine kinase [Sporosarcina sp. ACRSL]|uniref:sensor histidine kinase n=1 Tax=Sporosarcina sp. ACRSL TaxID=2918215 RepID=UPI001EF43880|nr:sensor histidine kinase [Sporosarcina sp. ACRSL]MCG7343606.1 sensor histidine kinase [Sporosarcina sp. ACRSL]